MRTYLVGGAVRDELLGRSPVEHDWVVVGATPDDMLRGGFKRVGRDFPVFLHPRTGDEYALARTERRTGPRHTDFICHADPGVTLEEDLARRDLTVNAMARDADRVLVDPYGGRRDIAARVLRHVSPAFAEDPLRVFRVARFAAQLPEFTVCDETLTLMRSMVPELAALSGERVWKELEKAAGAARPSRFFETVLAIGESHWFAGLDLAATAGLYGNTAFKDAPTALAAVGWVNAPEPVDRVFGRLRAPRLVRRAAAALAAHGRTLTDPHADPSALLDALTAIEAFRQNGKTALVADAAETCSGTSLGSLRRLIDELRGLRVDAEPGPGYGIALRGCRIAHIQSRRRAHRAG